MHPLLDINLVDFTSPDDIGGFTSLLCQTANENGMLFPDGRPTMDTLKIRKIANNFARKIEENLPKMSPGDALYAVEAYDLPYRLAYNRPASSTFIYKYHDAALNAIIHGDSTVDEYALYKVIDRAINRKDKNYFAKPLEWLTIQSSYWYKNVEGSTEYDTINRVSILLSSDLFVYEGNNAHTYKQQLFNKYRHYLEAHDTTTRRGIYAAEQLLHASYKFLSPEERNQYNAQIDQETLACPTLNRFLRATMEVPTRYCS